MTRCIHCGAEVKHKGNMGIPIDEHLDLGTCIRNLKAALAARDGEMFTVTQEIPTPDKATTRLQTRKETPA